MRPILISACLLGIPCRYNGYSKPLPILTDLLTGQQPLIPFCPETQGGLRIPRPPAEIDREDGLAVLEGKAKVVNQEGEDYTEQFINGAEAVLQMAVAVNPEYIVVKSNSPSCGLGWIYDGGFSGKLKPGNGVATARLKQGGFHIYTEEEFLKSWGKIPTS